MPETITLRYHSTQRDLADAMIAAGNALAGVKRDWPFFIGSILSIWLAAMGGMAIGSLIWMTGLDRQGSSLPWMIGGALLGFLLVRFVYKRMSWVQAGMLLHTRFGGQEQEMTLSDAGIDLRNGVADWHTDWAGVEAVVQTKTGLVFVVSGITLPVPDAAFGAMAKADVLARTTAWHEAARG